MSESVTWRPIWWAGEVKAHLIVAGDILTLCGVASLEYLASWPSEGPSALSTCSDCEQIAQDAFRLINGPRCRVCGCTDDSACMVDGVPCRWVEADLCSACVGHDTVDLVAALRSSVAAAKARHEAKATRP